MYINVVMCMKWKCSLLRHVWLFMTHGLYIACQAPLSMEFSRQEYWSMVAMPSSKGIFPTQRSNLGLLQLSAAGRFFTAEPLGKPSIRPWKILQKREHAYRPSRDLQSSGTEVCTDATVWISNDWRQVSPWLQPLILHHAPMSLVTVNPEAVM